MGFCFVFYSHLWRAALLGQEVDEKMEARSNQTARTVCQKLLNESQMALQKVHTNIDDSISYKNGSETFVFLRTLRSPSFSLTAGSQSGSSWRW